MSIIEELYASDVFEIMDIDRNDFVSRFRAGAHIALEMMKAIK